MPIHVPQLCLEQVPQSYLRICKPLPSLEHPKNVECSACGETFSSHDLIRNWALTNCGEEAARSYESGNRELHGFHIRPFTIDDVPNQNIELNGSMVDFLSDDCDCSIDLTEIGEIGDIDDYFVSNKQMESGTNLENSSRSKTNEDYAEQTAGRDQSCNLFGHIGCPCENSLVTARARLTLVTLALQTHKPGHVSSCFKYGNKHERRTICRHDMPKKTVAESHLVMNDSLIERGSAGNPLNEDMERCYFICRFAFTMM